MNQEMLDSHRNGGYTYSKQIQVCQKVLISKYASQIGKFLNLDDKIDECSWKITNKNHRNINTASEYLWYESLS